MCPHPSVQPNIGLVFFPRARSQGGEEGDPDIVAHQFLQVLEPVATKLVFITGGFPHKAVPSGKTELWEVRCATRLDQPVLLRALDHLLVQWKLSYRLVRGAGQLDLVVFVGTTIVALPMLTARLLRKKTLYINIGPIFEGAREIYRESPWGAALTRLISFLEDLHYRLADRAIVYSASCLTPEVRRHQHKVSVAARHFVDTDTFRVNKPLRDRERVIGYIGRLDADKGILELLEAIPLVLEQMPDAAFFIGGDGRLRERVAGIVSANNLGHKVRLSGWLSRREVAEHLNELKLCVLPSPTEGLPNIMLESMACGTPFLATPVAGIPDVVKDGHTGFIMEDNSPVTIARHILRALNSPLLEEVACNARAVVEKEFTYEAAVARYRALVADVLGPARAK